MTSNFPRLYNVGSSAALRGVFHPAYGVLGVVWLAAMAYLGTHGRVPAVLGGVGILVGVFVGCALTCWMTRGATEAASAPLKIAPWRLWTQTALALGVIALTLYAPYYLSLHSDQRSPVTGRLTLAGRLSKINAKNPSVVSAVVVSGAALLALVPLAFLGGGLRRMGFGPGRRVAPVMALWCTVSAVLILLRLLHRHLAILGKLGLNIGLYGPAEEFLFRGVLQTRLSQLFGREWGLVLQALIFGASRVPAAVYVSGTGELPSALALALVWQGAMGLAFGVIFERTGNIAASSVVNGLTQTVSGG